MLIRRLGMHLFDYHSPHWCVTWGLKGRGENHGCRWVKGGILEDRAPGRTDTWLVTMVIVIKSPIHGVMGPLTNGRTSWLINGGDPNYLLTGMILQVYNLPRRQGL